MFERPSPRWPSRRASRSSSPARSPSMRARTSRPRWWESSTKSDLPVTPPSDVYKGRRIEFLVLCLALAGCRQPASRAIASRQVSVRLAVLVPLHPAWAEVKQLDLLLSHASHLPLPSSQAAISLPEMPLPPALTVPAAPVGLPLARDVVTKPAVSRIGSLGEVFDDQNERILSRERATLLKKL